ncbi:MAG TPA: maltodextrin glucosidase [Aggregatilineaceae bacterium]|nr:maltodextrin glucosidase [Aggregatilineaceae bacterium]
MSPNRWQETLHHDGSAQYVTPGSHPIGSTVTIRLRAGRDAPLEQVYLRTAPDGEEDATLMQREPGDGPACWWRAELRLIMPRTEYRFYLVTAEGTWWYSAAGLTRHNVPDATDFKLLAGVQTPEWVRDSVFYQIFPDTFWDGDPSNNVRSGERLCYGRPVIARRWDELPLGRGQGHGVEFFGGDLAGIVQRLDYLQDLGVTALYLNPIFTSPSNHRYDIADFTAVDPHLGGDEALIALRQALDARGMRLVLDITPNHCSMIHPWFVAAQADPAAPTAEYFTFHEHPAKYEAWMGVRSLPKLDYRSAALREEMYAGQGAILRRWLRPPFRIDGWRLDVANMMGRLGASLLTHKVGRGIRRAVKEENPDAYLLGEHYFDGTPYLQGDELDASMNYQGFAFPLLAWLSGFDLTGAPFGGWVSRPPLPTEALAAQWRAYLAAIPWAIALQQFNLLGTHDTPRVATLLGDDEARIRAAATLLMTFPGVPSIYYGDEIGLSGDGDPDNRRPMIWDEARWNHARRALFQRLIALRRGSPALREGGFQVLHAAGDTLAFLREASDERLIVVARRGDDGLREVPVAAAALRDGTRLRELLGGGEATVIGGTLPLAGLDGAGAQVWRVVG